jgi:hypothetical protein
MDFGNEEYEPRNCIETAGASIKLGLLVCISTIAEGTG